MYFCCMVILYIEGAWLRQTPYAPYYTCIYIYIYANPPHELPRGAAIPPPIFLRLGFWCMIQFEVPRGQHMYDAAYILIFLRPFTQILRKMINDESFCLNTRRSIWARVLTPKIAFTVVSDQSPSNTYA